MPSTRQTIMAWHARFVEAETLEHRRHERCPSTPNSDFQRIQYYFLRYLTRSLCTYEQDWRIHRSTILLIWAVGFACFLIKFKFSRAEKHRLRSRTRILYNMYEEFALQCELYISVPKIRYFSKTDHLHTLYKMWDNISTNLSTYIRYEGVRQFLGLLGPWLDTMWLIL